MKMRSSNHKPTHDQIAQRAYALFEKSGRAPGHDIENWLRAERELAAASNEESEPKEAKNNGRVATTQPIAATRGQPRMERKYA